MARSQEPGSALAMVEAVLDAVGRARVAAFRDASPAQVSRYADPDAERCRHLTVPEFVQLCRHFPAGADVAAGYFAALAGGRFEPGTAAGSVASAAAALSRTSGAALALVAEALDPVGVGGAAITPREARAIGDVADTAQAAAARLMALVRAASGNGSGGASGGVPGGTSEDRP